MTAPNHDLRVRLLLAAILACGIATLHRLPIAGLALAGAAAFALTHAKPRALLHRLAHVEGFMIVLLVFLPFTMPGCTLLQIGPLSASAEGLARALLIAAKTNAVALVLCALFDRLEPERIGRSLAALGAPARLVRLMELLLRHSHTARDGLQRQSEAMRARAFRPATDLHTWRSYGHLFGGALLRAFDRAERVEEAMRLRGGALVHAALPPMEARNRALVALGAAGALALVLLDRLA